MYDLKQELLKTYPNELDSKKFVLSIGTSKDWESAMKEGGSNEIRIGTEIFGAREDKKVEIPEPKKVKVETSEEEETLG